MASAAPVARQPAVSRARALLSHWEVGLVALTVAVVVIGEIVDGDLLGSYNLETVATNNVVLACLAFGVAPVIMTGDIDISIAGILSLTGVVMGRIYVGGVEIWLAAALALVLAAVCGLINGLIVVLFDLPALAVTLGTMGAFTGVSFLILKGAAITTFPSMLVTLGSSNLSGTPVPISLVVVIAIGLLLSYLVHATAFGKSLFAIGGSRRAALFSGIAVSRVRITAFVMSGLFAGIAAVFYLGDYQTAQAGMASDQLLPAITAVILGGVSAYGGTGTIPGVAVAAVLLALLQSALGLHGLSGEGQTIAVGLLLIVAIGGGSLLRSAGALRHRLGGARPTGGARSAGGAGAGSATMAAEGEA